MASRRVKKVDEALVRFIEKSVRRLTLRVYQVMTTSTPVLTGFARAGWVVSTGAPEPGPSKGAIATGTGPRAELVKLQRAAAEALFSSNRRKANSVAASYRIAEGIVFIVNGVGYLLALNDGTSAQAPAMFIQIGIRIAVKATARELS